VECAQTSARVANAQLRKWGSSPRADGAILP